MISKISVIQYRKLKNIDLAFSSQLNFISGVNGTCKSSLLHMIANSFCEVGAKNTSLKDPNCLPIIKSINSEFNPKIETLTKGDKKYNNPAIGVKGVLFSVTYADGKELKFRRHNSSKNNRYAIKPPYSHGKCEKLPARPVIYLSLKRLYPIGEYQNDGEIKRIKRQLPNCYQREIATLYQKLTFIEITSSKPEKIGDIKLRNEFMTTKDGVDSFTISSGEDNIQIILTALESLKYYYQSLPEENASIPQSLLLIDEIDATLHPSLQEKLLEIIRDYCDRYKIQFFATTHSLSLLEYCLLKKDNVVYLCDDIDKVALLPDPDIFKIRAKLKTLSIESIYANRQIPVFTEDAEARSFLEYYMDYMQTVNPSFANIRNRFHFVNASFGADSLRGMFSDERLTQIMRAICILDGDKTEEHSEYVIALPGGASPEQLLFDYAEMLYNNDSDFWRTSEALYNNFDRVTYRNNIQPDYNAALTTAKSKREALKNLWKNNKTFIILVLKYWLNDPQNKVIIDRFTTELHKQFAKTAEYHGINKKDWSW